MSLRFNRVTFPRSPLHVVGFHYLANKGNINPVNPETLDRYARFTDAAKNVLRLAKRSDLAAFAIHEQLKPLPIGIATILFDVPLKFKDSAGDTVTRVADLDYALIEDADNSLHGAVAQGVVDLSRRIALKRKLGPKWVRSMNDVGEAAHEYCATIDPAKPDANRGFNMLPLQPVNAEYVVSGIDADGLTKSNDNLTYLYDKEPIGL